MKKLVYGMYVNHFDNKVFQSNSYMQFFSQFGRVRMINTTEDMNQVAQDIDVLVLPGGADVDPTRYNAVPWITQGRVNAHYEYLDKVLLPLVLELGKPVIGICRGMQSLNVHFGGTLHQEVFGHNQTPKYTRASLTQKLFFPLEDGKYISTMNKAENPFDEYYINSIHHQAVNELGEGLEIIGVTQVMANCPSLLLAEEVRVETLQFVTGKDKNKLADANVPVFVEAFQTPDLQVLGFQWHPEEFNCEFAINKIIEQQLRFYGNDEFVEEEVEETPRELI